MEIFIIGVIVIFILVYNKTIDGQKFIKDNEKYFNLLREDDFDFLVSARYGDQVDPNILFEKRVKNGLVSNIMLDDIKVGDKLVVSKPMGELGYNPIRDEKNVVCIAGGIGITPFISLAKAVCDNLISCDLTIVYSAKTYEDIIFKQEIEDINKTINESENLQEFFTKAAGQSFAEFNNEIGKFVSVKEGTADADNANPEENVDQIDFTNYNKQEILKKWEAVLESSRKVLENNIELPGIKVMVNAMSESHAKVLEQLGGDATAKKAEYDNIIKLIEAKEEEKEEEAAPDGTHGPAERNPGDSTANATFTETLNAIGETIGNIETKVGELNSSNDFTGINALLGIEAKHASGIGALLAGTQTNISALKPSDDDQTQAVNGLKERLNNAEKEFNTALNNFRIKYIQHKVQNDILQPLKDLNSATARTGHKWEQVTDKGMDLKNYSTLKENPR